MLKSFFTTICVVILTFSFTHAQTLKVTAVDASEEKIYNEVAPKALGKSMVLAIYDNSATVKVQGEDIIVLKQTSTNNYSKLEKDDEKESHTWYLAIDKTVGVITSATLKYLIKEKGGKYRLPPKS